MVQEACYISITDITHFVTDGVAQYRSSRVSIWPVSGVINELLFSLRSL